MDKRRKTLKNCTETDRGKCKRCSKCWLGRVLAEDDTKWIPCSGCGRRSQITNKDQPCPVCALCGSLAWMDEARKK